MIKKVDDGYKVDIRPAGRNGPRFRKVLASKSEAHAYERYILAKHKDPEAWHQKEPEKRRLLQLIERWHQLHGAHIKSGDHRMNTLRKIATDLKNPMARDFTANMFTDYRAKLLEEKAITPNTANHYLAYMRALFNELARFDEWQGNNPLAKVRALKVDETELTFLTHDQIDALLAELDESESHARITARICLATGARWGEAAKLKPSQVANGMVTFSGTKSGKVRSIPIAPELAELVRANAPLVDGLNTFRRTVEKMGLDLPKGQMTHVLRHTFASHFMINGGNILSLQRILGHQSLAMTMRYAHLSPDHFSDALTFNPLAGKVSTS